MRIIPISCRFARLAALLLTVNLPGFAATPNGPGTADANNPQNDSNSIAPANSLDSAIAGPGALIPGAPFSVDRQLAKPYMKVTFYYDFAAGEPPDQSHTYFMQCSRQDQQDNEGGLLGGKNLDADRQTTGQISGSFTVAMPMIAAYYGNYSFRIFGPKLVKGSASNVPGAQEIDSEVQTKLYDEGRFTFGPYQMALVAPDEIPPRHRMTITWTDASVNVNAWIGLFKSGMDNEHPIMRKSFINLPGSWDIDAPADLGGYEVRTFIDQGWDTTATRPFKVTWGTTQPVLSGFPASCYPDASMPVDYANGPMDINAWIGIFDRSNNGTSTRWSWQELQGKTSGEFVFTAPSIAGQYDLRMFDSSNNLLARSPTFQVVPASTTIKLKSAVDSGHIVLTWNNPLDYQMLDGYYVYRGTVAGAESTTPLTLAPIPADRSAAAAMMTNMHIDSDVQPGTKYFYVVKPLQVDLKTLGPASNEASAVIASAAGATAASTSSGPGGGSGGAQRTSGPGATTGQGSTGTRAIAVSASAAADTPATAIAVLGTRRTSTAAVALPGAWSEFGQAYRLGETDSLVFSLERAEYEASRLRIGNDLVSPKLGEKFLVAHFQVTNQRRQPLQLGASRFEWTVVDAKGASITDCERLGQESDPGAFEQTIAPGSSSGCFVIFRVPAEGELQSITVRNQLDSAPATARFNLRGKVRPLPAQYADSQDRNGATAAAVVPARMGTAFPCGLFDILVKSIETIGADSPVPADREVDLPVYATVRYTMRGAGNAGAFGGDAPVVTLIDSQGGSRGADADTFELATPETVETNLGPGESREFRLRFWIPRTAAPRELLVQAPGGIPVRVDLTK